jgi:hypothetical protein
MLGVRPSIACDFIVHVLKSKLVPMLHGSPGIGKSDIIKQVAEQFNLQVIDLRLSQCDPTDLLGFPTSDGKGKSYYAPMNTFPLEGDAIPKGKDGWLLFLDEFNSASMATQKAAYKLTLDRMIGQFNLNKKVAVVCAGNLQTDGALVSSMSTANQSRLVHVELQPNTDDWLEWAQSNGVDYRISAYISWKPTCLQMFDPDHSDKTFACPRTWMMASALIKPWDTISQTDAILLGGTLSEGVAREFAAFTKIFDQLPDPKQIVLSPSTATVPTGPSTLYALSAVIAENTNKETVTPFLEYLERIPKEFQIITVREMARRYPLVETNPKFISKLVEIATVL